MPKYLIVPPRTFPYYTLSEAAAKFKITVQKLSRILQVHRIRVHRIGYLILIPKIYDSTLEGLIRGRKEKSGTRL